jgi:glutamyl-tRNA reductase
MKKLDSGVDPDAIIKEMADRLTSKLLHAPFQNIKKTANINLVQCKACVPSKSKKTINISNS